MIVQNRDIYVRAGCLVIGAIAGSDVWKATRWAGRFFDQEKREERRGGLVDVWVVVNLSLFELPIRTFLNMLQSKKAFRC